MLEAFKFELKLSQAGIETIDMSRSLRLTAIPQKPDLKSQMIFQKLMNEQFNGFQATRIIPYFSKLYERITSFYVEFSSTQEAERCYEAKAQIEARFSTFEFSNVKIENPDITSIPELTETNFLALRTRELETPITSEGITLKVTEILNKDIEIEVKSSKDSFLIFDLPKDTDTSQLTAESEKFEDFFIYSPE